MAPKQSENISAVRWQCIVWAWKTDRVIARSSEDFRSPTHAGLDALVELHDRVVNRVSRGVGEPKQLIVHARGGVVEPLVDGGCARSTVDPDGISDFVLDVLRKVADDDIFCIRKHVLKRLDESELNERGSDPDSANEEAHERRRVGRVRDEPHESVSRLWLESEHPRKEPRYASAESLVELGMEGQNVLVGELESGDGSASRRKGIQPLIAYGVDGFLDLAESIPFDKCTTHGSNHHQADKDECSRLSNVDERVADVIYNRRVDIIAKLDGPDCWEWELGDGESGGGIGELIWC